ncbi:MAG: ABC transporter permease [Dehalococcoidia bacterium]
MSTATHRAADNPTGAIRAIRGAAADYLPPLLLVAALIGLWELWVRWTDQPAYLYPAPSRIWSAFLDIHGVLPGHVRTTTVEAAAGLGAAAVVGVALAALIASLPLARRVIYPVLVTSQTIPMVVLAPLLIVWFGLGLTPKVVIVALVGFFPIVVSTTDGLTNADREMVELVRSMGAGRFQVLRQVRIPAAVPAFFSGLKIAAAYAVVGAVIAEWVGASSGLGLFMERSRTAFRTDQVFVGIALVALMSIALFGAVHVLARIASPWMYAHTTEEE